MKPYMNMKSMVTALAVLTLAGGCASGGGGGSTPGGSHFARGIGVASGPDLQEKVARFMALYAFEIEREEGPPSVYIESRWRERNVFPDERVLGISAAEIRATVRARPRSGASGMGEVYNVDLVIEQRVRVPGEVHWNSDAITPQAEELAASMAEELRRDLNVGVRRF
jgi:hypothetical protein